MKKYVAEVKDGLSEDKVYEIEGYAQSPQEFHKIVLNEHINYKYDEILYVFNNKGKRVFNYKRGFNGS